MAAFRITIFYFVSFLMREAVSTNHDWATLYSYDIDFIHRAVSGALANSNSTRPTEGATRLVRLRRQTNPYGNMNVRGFSAGDKRILVTKHNELRGIPRSSDMNFMYWDPDLEALAQGWAENCDFYHNPNRRNGKFGVLGPGPFAYVGENLYAGTGGFSPAMIVQAWYDEDKFYNYDTKSCSNVCGHYTQIVWATTYALGCGVAYCPELKKVSFGRGWHVVCNYGPGGNYVNEHPYKTGEAISQCEQDAIFRVNNLCAKYPVIGASSADIMGSRGPQLILLIGCLLSMIAMSAIII